MPRNMEENLAVNRGEKLLPVDKSPEHDISDDVNNEEFITANEKGKFVPMEGVADPDSDFTEKEVENDGHGEEIDSDKAIEEIRRDIGTYNYQEKGDNNGGLASFHVDHDDKSLTAVREKELVYNETTQAEFIKDAPEEEEFAEVGVSNDKKISHQFATGEFDRIRDINSSKDNLKTRPLVKLERDNRGLIRKFLDTFSKN